MKKIFFILFLLTISGTGWCMEIKTNAFGNGATIPNEYTCKNGVSPELSWQSVPANAKTLVLICEDPDAPSGTWSHWIVFNIPSTRTSFEKGVKLNDGSIEGTNDYGKTRYDGPCPPPGKPHRYFFRLFAIDAKLPLDSTATLGDVKRAMQDHIIAKSEWMGIFGR